MADTDKIATDKIEAPDKAFVAKVHTTALEWDYENPWSPPKIQTWTGSGFILPGMRFITNAHVAAGATHMEVQLAGSSKKFVATKKHITNECDLAQLEIEDPEFWAGTEAVEVAENPELGSDVRVVGFPMGGKTVSYTQGIVSRCEKDYYAQSGREFMSTQVDAPINPGNSGGPVVNRDNQVVGVAFQGMNRGQNIGYMIPASILQHFLKEVTAEEKGFPDLAIETQNLENNALREYYKLGDDQSGVIVNKIANLSPCHGVLREGDVLLELEGLPINGDGGVYINPMKKIDYTHIINEKELGDEVTFKVWRNGQELEKQVKLSSKVGATESIIPEEHDKPPTYYILGGQIVVQPVTENYMSATRRNYKNEDKVNPDDQLLSISRILKCKHTSGYTGLDGELISHVNGKEVRNMHDLIAATEGSQSAQHVIKTNKGHVIAIPNLAVADQQAILSQYYIPKDRSEDLPRRAVDGKAEVAPAVAEAAEAEAVNDAKPPVMFSSGLLDFADYLDNGSDLEDDLTEDESLDDSLGAESEAHKPKVAAHAGIRH